VPFSPSQRLNEHIAAEIQQIFPGVTIVWIVSAQLQKFSVSFGACWSGWFWNVFDCSVFAWLALDLWTQVKPSWRT